MRELGPGEIVILTPEGIQTLAAPGKKMKICTFLWIYYGYPSSSYEGISVEQMRYRCGAALAKRDAGNIHPDIVAGVPDSGIAHAIGYANESKILTPVHLSNIHPHGPVPLCPLSRAAAISLPK